MKLLFLLFSLLFSMSFAHAKSLIVGVSPYWDDTSHQQQFVQVMKFASSLDVGDRVILIDAFNLTSLGEFVIPEGKLYQNPKFLLQKNGKVVAALKNVKQSPQGVTRVNGAVRLPHFLSYVAEYYSHHDDKTIAMIGSPFFDDVREPSYSMLNGFFPNDTHITASFEKSLFGTKGLETQLKDWDIHFAYSDSAMMSSRHAYYIGRFLSLYVENLGGRLATFTSDIALTLKRAWSRTVPTEHSYTLKPADRLQMLRLRISDSQIPIHSRRLSSRQLSDDELVDARDVQISAVWDCECDIDLYARGNPYAEIISFEKSNTDEGWYFKDVRSIDNNLTTYESIEFYNPINLNTMQIALAFYSGHAPQGVNGSLRLAVGDDTYAIPFHIDTTQGNNTIGVKQSFSTGQAIAPHIIMIDALEIVSQKR